MIDLPVRKYGQNDNFFPQKSLLMSEKKANFRQLYCQKNAFVHGGIIATGYLFVNSYFYR